MNAEQQALCTQYMPMAYKIANGMVRRCPHIERDELWSAAMLGLAEAANTYQAKRANFPVWVHTCVRRALIDYVRAEVKQHEVRKRYKASIRPTLRIALDYWHIDLEERLHVLPPFHREICELIYAHDLTQHQVAQHLGCSQSTVSKTQAEAVAIMRKVKH